MENLVIDSLPNGLLVASGGTRTEIKLSRPWQSDIRVDPSTCPFETPTQSEIARWEQSGGWRLLKNLFTPHDWHVLLVPFSCWPPSQIRTLGGMERIAAALHIVTEVLGNMPLEEYWLGVHIGPLAGQNIGHLHYHLIKPLSGPAGNPPASGVVEWMKNSRLTLLEDSELKTVLGGLRAGQCFVFPAGASKVTSGALAAALDRLIGMYSASFMSREGLPPDYSIAVKFVGAEFQYATLVPILNHWGFTEFMGLLENRPIILPWPNDESLRQLLLHPR
jgi:diadenosine tetraphosphate (Ap4A) HIT family hydrolase